MRVKAKRDRDWKLARVCQVNPAPAETVTTAGIDRRACVELGACVQVWWRVGQVGSKVARKA